MTYNPELSVRRVLGASEQRFRIQQQNLNPINRERRESV
ncbi:hypothetical protein BofuT4_uP046620.1 [Botrytis cinerea T4]|uniref:Uncharacterized protein n=1 Tax=Botryotinia fuckeliana (strain T4) TaxID=999810 RepID=G2XYV7_BOTF4|nr:hypothetical protein BofuT4_uP046620.1 [Botrytis cinerea T4]